MGEGGGMFFYKMIVTVAARSKSRRTIALTQVLEVKEEEPVLGWSVLGDSAEDI